MKLHISGEDIVRNLKNKYVNLMMEKEKQLIA